jgi:glycosyltransferase involved in cell wall biosynthesis
MKINSLSLILPAYNEEENIKKTLDSITSYLPAITDDWEVIVVNDGSVDNTEWFCKSTQTMSSQIRVYNHAVNRGYGAALQTGIFEATKEFIFFMDSDGQFDITEIELLIAHIGEHDLVAGYRHERSDHWTRKLNAWGWNKLVKTVLGIKIIDIDCAFKMFRRTVFDKVMIRSVGAMVNTEILTQMRHFNMRIKEVPVSHFPRLAGQSTGANIFVIIRAFRELILMWFKLRKVPQTQRGLLQGRPTL